MGNRTLKTQTGKGMAMVMMLILVPILMFLAMSFVDPIVRSFRSAVNDQKTLLAKNVADSMFEVALWDSRGAGVGENKKNEGYPDPIIKEYDFGTATVRWSVMATPDTSPEKLIDDQYTIPSPGSGTAGDDYCSTSEPVVDDEPGGSLEEALAELEIARSNLGGDFYTAFDWPCNWNKLREGESIVIPLYTEDENGVYHPFENPGVNDFTLTVRPACDPSKATSRDNEYENQICKDNERYDLVGDQETGNLTVIVLWEITGKLDENGETVYLTHKDDGTLFDPKTTLDVEAINFQNPLTQNSKAKKPIDNDEKSIENFLSTLYKPELKLLVVHTLRDNYGVVPYLEYQFSSTYNTASTPISSTSKVVHVEVMIDGGYSTSIDKIVGIAKSVSGFVIQQ
ncbi:hypothetical protein C0416_01445 [bacterium]|nr:hypothetical protein [bacterium]